MTFWSKIFGGQDTAPSREERFIPARACYATAAFLMPDDSVHTARMVKTESGRWEVFTGVKSPNRKVHLANGNSDVIEGFFRETCDGEYDFPTALTVLSAKESQWGRDGKGAVSGPLQDMHFLTAGIFAGYMPLRSGEWKALRPYGLSAGVYAEEDIRVFRAASYYCGREHWLSESFLSEDNTGTAEETAISCFDDKYYITKYRKPKDGKWIEAIPIPYNDDTSASWPLEKALEYLGVEECANRLKKKTCVLSSQDIPPEAYYKTLALENDFVMGVEDGKCLAYGEGRYTSSVLKSDLDRIEKFKKNGTRDLKNRFPTLSNLSNLDPSRAPLVIIEPVMNIKVPEGAWVPGQGTYIGDEYFPNIREAFNVFAAPQDTREKPAEAYKVLDTLIKKKDWFGHDGTSWRDETDLHKHLENGTYGGRWFTPTKDMHEQHLKNCWQKGILKGSFATGDKEYVTLHHPENKNGFHSFYGFNLNDDYSYEWEKARCRPVRMVKVPPFGAIGK